jgi:hypothetical protein
LIVKGEAEVVDRMNVCSSRSTATALEGDSYGDFDMSSKQVECLQSRTRSVHMPEHFNLLLNYHI